MPMVTLPGKNRWRGYQEDNTRYPERSLVQPTFGFGPAGMPGSLVDGADLAQRRQQQQADAAQLGLFWNGSGIVQGRPIRDIVQGQDLAQSHMDLQKAQFASGLTPESQQGIAPLLWGQKEPRQVAGGVAGPAPSTGIAPVASGTSTPASSSGIAPVASGESRYAGTITFPGQKPIQILKGTPSTGIAPVATGSPSVAPGGGVVPFPVLRTNADVQAEKLRDIEQQRANAGALGVVGGLVPGSGQDYAAGVVGLPKPPTGGLETVAGRQAERQVGLLQNADKRAENTYQLGLAKLQDLPEDLTKDPATLAAVRQLMTVDPKAPDADAQYAAIGRSAGMPLPSHWPARNDRLLAEDARRLIGIYGPFLNADNKRRERIGAWLGGVSSPGAAGGGGLVPAPGAGPQPFNVVPITRAQFDGTQPGPTAKERTATGTPGGMDQAIAVPDDRLVEAYFTKYGGRLSRDVIRAKLAQMSGQTQQ